MDPSRIWNSTLFPGSSNLLSRANEELWDPSAVISKKRTQRHAQETETQVPTHQNFTQQGSTAVPLASRSPPRGGLLLTPVDSGLRRRCKASAPIPIPGPFQRSEQAEALLGTDSLWKPTRCSSFRQVSSHPHLFPGRIQRSAPALYPRGCWVGPLLPTD